MDTEEENNQEIPGKVVWRKNYRWQASGAAGRRWRW